MLLKRDFAFVDGLGDPAINGSLVVPATSDFTQIINTGGHWVCLSTISTTPSPGTVKIFHSMYCNANSTSIEHACRMLMYPGEKVTIVNEKVQRQVGGSDCGLFSLAFATDLCHGIAPQFRNTTKDPCDNTMSTAWKMAPCHHSPKQKRECHFTWAARSHWLLFTACVDYQMIKKNTFSAAMANAKNGIIQNVLKYQTG